MTPAEAQDTRSRLIETGIRLLTELVPSQIVAAVGSREIARQAGVSSPSFFHHFGTVDQYTQEVLAEIFRPTRMPRAEPLLTDFKSIADDNLPVTALLAAYRRTLERNLGDPEYRLKLGMWALGGTVVDSFYREYDEFVMGAVAAGSQYMLESWGREPRPPFDLMALVAIGNALARGSYIAHTLDEHRLTVDHFINGILATVLVGVRLKGDNRNMTDRLAEMNYYPRDASSKEEPSTDRGTRDRLIDAAAELFAEYGAGAVSVAQLARRAGVSTSTFFNVFNSKDQLALALFNRFAEIHIEAFGGRQDPDDPVADYLMTIAELADRQRDLAKIFLAELSIDDLDRIGAEIVEPLGEMLRATSDRDLAQSMITVTVQRILRHPGQGTRSAAQWAMRLMLDINRD
jgi:AcrR family transcriptional regulator